MLAFTIILLESCSQQKTVTQQEIFYNIDSLVTRQLQLLNNHELSKSVNINGKKDSTHFTPDTTQWKDELDIFRQIDQVNKASFRDAYVVSDIRDTNSNLMVREIKSTQEIPVTLLKLYYLRTLSDLRRVEATLQEENNLYVNERHMTLEFDGQILARYSIEGRQRMVMEDSIKFSITATVK